ncbi:LysR family transcriptional regulator [Allopusillimonas ginsengisoli]|uniref:LysR family transcriptional regulator n=1 Tax=Allopusillimonas ginsengisoli TaxID=453575 RepID=UPI0014853434
MLWIVATAGSISAAARQLDVSQPAISRMLAQTEAQAGIQFFERIRGRLRATKQLVDLLPDLERAQMALQRINDKTLALSDAQGGVLKVACNPSLSKHVMPRVLSIYRGLYPDTFLRFHTATIDDIIPSLLGGEIDIALMTIPADHPFLSSATIVEGTMTAVVPRDNPLAERAHVSLEEVALYPHILVGERLHFGMIVSSAFGRAGIQPRIVADVPWCDLACALVNQGMGCAIVDEFSISQYAWANVRAVPLQQPIPIRLHAVHAINRPMSEVAARFVRIVKQMQRDGELA